MRAWATLTSERRKETGGAAARRARRARACRAHVIRVLVRPRVQVRLRGAAVLVVPRSHAGGRQGEGSARCTTTSRPRRPRRRRRVAGASRPWWAATAWTPRGGPTSWPTTITRPRKARREGSTRATDPCTFGTTACRPRHSSRSRWRTLGPPRRCTPIAAALRARTSWLGTSTTRPSSARLAMATWTPIGSRSATGSPWRRCSSTRGLPGTTSASRPRPAAAGACAPWPRTSAPPRGRRGRPQPGALVLRRRGPQLGLLRPQEAGEEAEEPHAVITT
ncbi:unnamed protein product, partial [Prorocentrum cordatum]